ncbi:Delta(12)-acyl-lipid-desaturase [Lachnellula suecica]|uniref:Delta(12)-acyl-lipid-desaturase n=1 Tax=Lachnellula suecica TaxID=602035 RepID=A0A8T9C0I2_9HELO|nr:Delta(12)-acyl-lipid-desaturase [Lachnellula suecica]
MSQTTLMTMATAATKQKVQSDLADQKAKYGVLKDANGKDFMVPDYTLAQIYDAIPKECFERSVVKSLLYLFQDLALVTVTFLAFSKFNTPDHVPSIIIRSALWVVYGTLQMVFGCGIWINAHECGHMAFSQHKTLNDTIGFLLHSAVLVPYFSWKISHKGHHKGVGSMASDTAFTPPTRLGFMRSFNKSIEEIAECAEDAPITALIETVMKVLFTWQAYTFVMMGVGEFWFQRKAAKEGDKNPEMNEDGNIKRTYGLGGSLFNPYGPYFEDKDAKLVYLSDAAILATLGLLYLVGASYGWSDLMLWYAMPYVLINACVIFLASLQHTDASIPRYDANTWTFIRGAASTIDRDLGFLGRYLWHSLNETHVLHHHISTIPHYHARKATAAIKPIMGVHYRSNTSGLSNLRKTFGEVSKSCQWVESSEGSVGKGKGVLFYRGLANVN